MGYIQLGQISRSRAEKVQNYIIFISEIYFTFFNVMILVSLVVLKYSEIYIFLLLNFMHRYMNQR